MTKQLSPQLDKILAMADSSHESEALVAVRMARQILSRDGLCFADLARAVQKPRINLPFGFTSSQQIVNLETEILQLQQQMEDIRQQKVAFELEAEALRQRVADLEQKLGQSTTDANRWRQLARDTVEKLWDLGQSMTQDEPQLADIKPSVVA